MYGVMGCTDEQRVLFSSFLMEDRAKDWWDAIERRYPDGISWDQFQQEFTDRFFPQIHKDSKIDEFFRLEQKNMSVSDYEKRFSELVRLVPYRSLWSWVRAFTEAKEKGNWDLPL